MTTPLYSIQEIREIERAALADLPPGTLMRRAGQAAADLALALLAEDRKSAPVLALAGPGNNGGDAFVAAAILALSGIQVSILSFGEDAKRSADALHALERARESPVRWLQASTTARYESIVKGQKWGLVIDGLFGIGLKQALSGDMRALVGSVNELSCPVLALDNPSGLDAETGAIAGDGAIAVRATHTITFIGDKPGLHTLHGRDLAGEVHVAVLGIPPVHFPQPTMRLNGIPLFADCLHSRRHESHKGTYGNVAIVGGSQGMTGAPILSARAALHCGAGRVYAAFPDELPPYDPSQPELMFRQASEFDNSSAVVVAGPGLGRSGSARKSLERILGSPRPLVLDADALNLLADEPAYARRVARREAGTLLTPHPLEAARLLGVSSAEVQACRIESARKLARDCNAVVALKGSGTVIAAPSGEIAVNPTGNPALATAGTGDVLAGICGALLAQQWPLWQAALGAVWMHGGAADELVRQGIGPIGMTAGELVPAVRAYLNRLVMEVSASRVQSLQSF